eukprot:1278580-Amphidinium_carterae.1
MLTLQRHLSHSNDDFKNSLSDMTVCATDLSRATMKLRWSEVDSSDSSGHLCLLLEDEMRWVASQLPTSLNPSTDYID